MIHNGTFCSTLHPGDSSGHYRKQAGGGENSFLSLGGALGTAIYFRDTFRDPRGAKGFKWFRMVQMVQPGAKGFKWFRMVQMVQPGAKWFKWFQVYLNGFICFRWGRSAPGSHGSIWAICKFNVP